ncbi:MAG TPA: sulfur oxidation c-type cytochrome SoxA [Thiobacillus sp.]|nr:MAG: sulfur oxidation c-type cytochrome SoxX [Hydrogenophilales bacterium 16-64-40]HQS82675.1 sulfur oxidation c-type cytochrome SoxA [Thiobacillus sp.]HQT33017.1 sulfur oxidation c-type cytochrome SoxA [Thiobacillus sp.]
MENSAFARVKAACFSLSTLLGAMTCAAFPLDSDAQQPQKAVPMELAQPAAATPWSRYSDWPATDWKDYNTLANLASPAYAPPPKLAGPIAGDPKNGEKLAFDRGRGGSCVACHVMGKTTPALPGNIGPDLSTVGTWGRSDQKLFDYVYDPRSVNPNSMMPPWGAHKLFSVQEIHDIVAFMKTLKAPHVFKDELENPATRPVPVETRDNLDPFENDGMAAIDRAKLVYSRVGSQGKSCASCHAAPEKSFRTWAATMPRYEARLKKVIGVEEFITRHARSTTGDNLLMQSMDNIDLSIYLRHLANGTPIKVDTTSKDAVAAIKRGNALMTRKIGQLNFACLDCHGLANKWVRGQWLAQPKRQAVFNKEIAHFPTFRTSSSEIWDFSKRVQWCNVAIRANELPPDAVEYGDIELALAALTQGQKVNVPGIRN